VIAQVRILETIEHHSFSEEDKQLIPCECLSLRNDKIDPKYLGISAGYSVGYFIGAKWLKENEIALVVSPKIKDLDYLKMFVTCFNNPITSKVIKDIYDLEFESTPIELRSNQFELTPLIIIHFMNLVRDIVKKGIKKDYITVENNLNSKIKGKILFKQNIKLNTNKARPDRIFCRYQEYSVDCIENRIIKLTLEFVSKYIQTHYKDSKYIVDTFSYCFGAFHNVSDITDIKHIRKLKHNKDNFYKEYNEALRLAIMILKKFDYSIKNTMEKTEKYPPFHIDMSLLFELYAYSKLYEVYGKNILYHPRGNSYGETDFLNIDDKTVIDTKYKEIYCNNQYDIENIRQLSGYARDIGVLAKLGFNTDEDAPVLDCVIIYPDQNCEVVDIKPEIFKNKKIGQFYKFYKYGIKLPVK
jgi:5-methylcytosine-specific restriction enzyme subunit McrC